MKRLRGCLMWIGIGFVVVIVIGGIASLMSPGSRGPEGSPQEPPARAVPTFTPTPVAQVATAMPLPTATDIPIARSDAETYRATLAIQAKEIGEALTEIGSLMGDLKLTDTNWILRMGVAIARVELAHEALLRLEPPPEYAEFHRKLTNATTSCATSVRTLSLALDNQDVAALSTAATFMTQCGNEMQAVSAEIPW